MHAVSRGGEVDARMLLSLSLSLSEETEGPRQRSREAEIEQACHSSPFLSNQPVCLLFVGRLFPVCKPASGAVRSGIEGEPRMHVAFLARAMCVCGRGKRPFSPFSPKGKRTCARVVRGEAPREGAACVCARVVEGRGEACVA